MEIGIYTFAETSFDPTTGRQLDVGRRLQDLLEEIELADEVGLDVFGVGEHHRPDYAVSTPAVILAAAAARTKRIRLTSAVSVLSSDDPVRVFQDFATLDQISGGRAEIMVGRGSFTESFPLFGQDLSDYDDLFSEKLDLLLRLREEERITWSGQHRPSIDDRASSGPPSWAFPWRWPSSAARQRVSGTWWTLYRETAAQAGHDPATLPISINSHGFLADDPGEAAELAFPPFAETMTRIGRERGWPPTSRSQFDAETTLRGAIFVGSPQEVIDKILYQYEIFRHQRFLIQLTVGPMPHPEVMRAIELLGTEVAPVVRREVGAAAGYSP